MSCPCSGLSAAHISILAASITCGGKYLSIEMGKHLNAGKGLGTEVIRTHYDRRCKSLTGRITSAEVV